MTHNQPLKPLIISQLEMRLTESLPGINAHRLMVNKDRLDKNYDPNPKDAKKSAVIVLLFFKDNQLYTSVIQRTIDGGPHSGQISFPGGKAEKSDLNLIATAQRECFEEIGIEANKLKIIGLLSKLYIPISNFMVQPVLAYLDKEPIFVLQKTEVSKVLNLSIESIFSKSAKSKQTISIKGIQINTPAYQLENCMIWGATAMILSELEVLLNEIGYLESA